MNDRIPRLLVCCEESQRVCIAFRAHGWEAHRYFTAEADINGIKLRESFKF